MLLAVGPQGVPADGADSLVVVQDVELAASVLHLGEQVAVGLPELDHPGGCVLDCAPERLDFDSLGVDARLLPSEAFKLLPDGVDANDNPGKLLRPPGLVFDVGPDLGLLDGYLALDLGLAGLDLGPLLHGAVEGVQLFGQAVDVTSLRIEA